MDETYQAAKCRHLHGDPRESADEQAARKGLSDLYGRTDPTRKLARDESRLASRYRRTIDAAGAADIEAWRICPKCSSPSV